MRNETASISKLEQNRDFSSKPVFHSASGTVAQNSNKNVDNFHK
jgi:hypothetical protein